MNTTVKLEPMRNDANLAGLLAALNTLPPDGLGLGADACTGGFRFDATDLPFRDVKRILDLVASHGFRVVG